MNYELHHGDCLEVMRDIPDGSIDCVITDPPYGTTACKWDSVIPFEPMWKELKRIAKPKAAICLFGSQPFTSALVMSNPKMFRYQWVWDKQRGSNYLQANKQPMKYHEDVCVFYSALPTYNPQKEEGKPYRKVHGVNNRSDSPYRQDTRVAGGVTERDGRLPQSIIRFGTSIGAGRLHPTQKPVDLLRYLVRTYTQKGETVLDFTMGSGSTGVACQYEQRRFIGIEKDENYFNIAQNRIEAAMDHEIALSVHQGFNW